MGKLGNSIRLSEYAEMKQFAFLTLVVICAYFTICDIALADLVTGVAGAKDFLAPVKIPTMVKGNTTDHSGAALSFTTTPTGWVLCNVAVAIEGTTGKGIATMGIIYLALAALFAQIKWTQAIMVGCGIAAIFGGASIVGAITGHHGCLE